MNSNNNILSFPQAIRGYTPPVIHDFSGARGNKRLSIRARKEIRSKLTKSMNSPTPILWYFDLI